MKPPFKNAVFISMLGHLTALGMFSFSFGYKPPQAEFATASFWGVVLARSQIVPVRFDMPRSNITKNIFHKPLPKLVEKKNKEGLVIGYLKPQVNLAETDTRQIPFAKLNPPLALSRLGHPGIVFHPNMPYNFLLFFNDRQTAHIELMFKLTTNASTNSIIVKRKISSGNLEVDLLSMRYINHYLYIEQSHLVPGTWQTIKIDLSAKND